MWRVRGVVLFVEEDVIFYPAVTKCADLFPICMFRGVIFYKIECDDEIGPEPVSEMTAIKYKILIH